MMLVRKEAIGKTYGELERHVLASLRKAGIL
jgi:hypothetical protein